MMVFLHSALFVALSSFSPASLISRLYASFHLRVGRPLLLFPGMSTCSILLTTFSCSLLSAWSYNLICFRLFAFYSCCSSNKFNSDVILFFTSHNHLCIIVSFTYRRASSHLCRLDGDTRYITAPTMTASCGNLLLMAFYYYYYYVIMNL